MKRLLLLLSLAVGIATAFGLGYGSTSEAFPAGGVYGRAEYRGYFSNYYDTAGTYVLPRNYNNGGVMEAFPGYIDTAQEFIDFVKANLVNPSNTQQKTGAAFIINTMINTQGVSSVKPPTPAQITLWENTVKTAAALGRITWRANFSYTINSYYQGPTGGCSTCPDNDNAFYDETGTAASMIFRDGSGNIRYVLKWLCANPLGPGLTSLPLPWEVFGSSSVSDGVADPGDTPIAISTRPGDVLTFQHQLFNGGPGGTSPDRPYYRINDTVNGTIIVPATLSGPYAVNQTIPLPTSAGLTVTVPLSATPGTQFCQSIDWFWRRSWDPNWGPGTPACATVVGNYNLNPTINAQINGGPVTGAAEPGDTITFTYAVSNSGTTSSSGTNCTALGQTFTGFHATPAPPEVLSTPVAGMGCPRNFAVGGTTLTTETVTAAANSTVCRTLSVNPATSGGGVVISPESCVLVASKPYARTYGGDISAGGGLATSTGGSCTLNNGAAIIGWNRRSSTWAGAGVQFAAYAMSTIFDTATSLGNGAGSAPRPDGLSFANVGTSTATGDFGGNLGAVGCIPDYYSRRPATTTTPPTGSGAITAMTTGTYGTNSNEYFSGSGNIDPGERITVYVNGDAYINANITYTGTWTTDSIPSFRLIARGNIYIDRNVSRIDGLYVAQANGPSGGEIHTCANTSPTYAALPLTNIGTQCAGKLTVNGSLVARQIRLIRTIGTQRSATETETAAAGNMAEAFNYSPIMWIPQPDDEGGPRDYDAINSLPPVL